MEEQHVRDLMRDTIRDQIDSRVEQIKKAVTALETRVKSLEDRNEKQDDQLKRMGLTLYGDKAMNFAGLIAEVVSVRKLTYLVIGLMILSLLEEAPEWWPAIVSFFVP